MKICTSYYQKPQNRLRVDEVRFSVYVLNNAMEFAEAHADKRVIIEILNLHDNRTPSIEKLYTIITETPNHNIAYDFYSIVDLEEYHSRTHRENNPYMYHHPLMTWTQIYQLLSWYNVSDITIGEPLTFECFDIIRLLKDPDLTIRVRPYPELEIWEKSNFQDNGIKHFWIPPQYLDKYEDVFDVIDVLHPNIVREEALVEAYLDRTNFDALDLSTVIPNVNVSVPIAAFEGDFFDRRLNCGQRCLKSPASCHMCDATVDLWKVLKKMRKETPSDNSGTT